jgi:hypothetical protein
MATIKRFESIEIVIPIGSSLTRYYFPDLPNLRNALIDRLVIFPNTAISPSVLTGGYTATYFAIQRTSITLYAGDQQLIYNCPLSSLINIAVNTSDVYYNLPLEFNGQVISWTKSYISSPYPQDDNNVVFSFGCFYHF